MEEVLFCSRRHGKGHETKRALLCWDQKDAKDDIDRVQNDTTPPPTMSPCSKSSWSPAAVLEDVGEVVRVVHGSVPEQLQARGVLKKILIRKKDKMKGGS